MKEKQNKRLGLKILSFICAFFVWLGVVNVADPITTATVEIPVEIVNAEILEQNGLTYEIVGKRTATVSYEVKTTNAYRIRSSDFRAYADMTEMWSVTGAIPIKIEVLSHSEYLVSNPVSKTSTIKIETEPLQRKRFDLHTTLLGNLEEEYEVGEITLSPDYLYVEGPESLIGQISSVGVEISVAGVTADASGVAVPRYYDANGNKIELSSRIESDCESVEYTLQVLKVKNLTLDFDVSGRVADGYRFTGVECDVKSVPVIGLKSVLASLNTIMIPAEMLNLDNARADVVKTIDLTQLLPMGVSLAGTNRHEISVTLTVERLSDRIYTVEVNEACYEGENDDYVYKAEPGTVNIRVRALEEELDSLSLNTSDLSVDVSAMTEGLNAANVRIKTELGQAYDVISISSCSIRVARMPEGPGTTESAAETSGTAQTPETTENGTSESSSGQTEASRAPSGQ